MQGPTHPRIAKPNCLPRRISPKKIPKKLEITPIYLPPHPKSNLHNKNNMNWRTHPIITQEINNHTHTTITPPPNPSLLHNSWIDDLARIAKEAKNKAHKITTDYTTKQIEKTISKYQQLYNKNP